MVSKTVEYKTKNVGGYDVIHIGICDDERVTSSELERILLNIGKTLNANINIEIWEDGIKLCEYLKSIERLDLIFLDIELYELSGIQVANYIRNELNDLKTSIVFISHKQNYAMDLFEMQPLDFIVKPLSEEKILKVVKTFNRYFDQKKLCFEYKKGAYYYKEKYEDIIYFRSNNRKIEIVLSEGVEEFYGKLDDILKDLPEFFFKIHKSYIINQNFVITYTYEQVSMVNRDILSISRSYRKRVRDQIRKLKKELLLGD